MSQAASATIMAAETQQKFEFYFLTLTFGILALSVQTVSFAAPLVAQCSELLGWVALLLSGVMGLWRMEWTVEAYRLMGLQDQAADTAHQSVVKKASGVVNVHVTKEHRDYPIEDIIRQAESDQVTVGKKLDPVILRLTVKKNFQQGLFIFGLLCLLVSRGSVPALNIVAAARL